MAGTSFIVVAGGITLGNEVTNTVEMIELRLENHQDNDDHFWRTGKKDHINGIVNPFFSFTVKGRELYSLTLVKAKRGGGSKSKRNQKLCFKKFLYLCKLMKRIHTFLIFIFFQKNLWNTLTGERQPYF